jgi:hypothetical protein
MGEMGQLRKEREWREEKDLRAVGEGEGEEVAEGLGGVAEGGVVLALAGVLGGWDVEGLKGSQLLWVKRGGRR